MRITKRTTKDHGPCDTCGHPILKGMAMRTTSRECRSRTEWPNAFRGAVRVKVHLGCPHPSNRRTMDLYGPWPLLTVEDDLKDWSKRLSNHVALQP